MLSLLKYLDETTLLNYNVVSISKNIAKSFFFSLVQQRALFHLSLALPNIFCKGMVSCMKFSSSHV